MPGRLPEEPPDHDWLKAETERRHHRFTRRQQQFDADRRLQRAELTTLELHRLAIEREAKLSTVAAGNVEPSRGGSDRIGPPRQQLLDDDPIWREHWQIIRSRLLRAHESLDEAEGLGANAVRTMLTDEKDLEVLRKGRGLSAQAVVDLLGRDIAGSAETVRRKRRRTHDQTTREFQLLGFAVSVKDGEPILDRSDRPPNQLRRVVIDDER